MNISFNTQSPYSSFYQKGTLMGQNSQQRGAGSVSPFASGNESQANPLSKFANKVTEDKASISQQMRQMIRDLKQEQYAPKTSKDKVNGFSELSGSPDAAEEEEIDTSEKYNYKTVASKIQRAKTSISAGQAVLAAKRETLKIKRKISSGNGDPEELQQMTSVLASAEEEKITEKEDAIFDAREEMLDAALQQMQEGEASFSEEELKELNEMISEFGEEELKELEEAMELMETMEVVDPHMSKADLEDLKRKHRASEDKAIMKANMEYLKDMIKHELAKNASMPSMGGGGISSATSVSLPQSIGISVSAPQMQAPTIDIQA